MVAEVERGRPSSAFENSEFVRSSVGPFCVLEIVRSCSIK